MRIFRLKSLQAFLDAWRMTYEEWRAKHKDSIEELPYSEWKTKYAIDARRDKEKERPRGESSAERPVKKP